MIFVKVCTNLAQHDEGLGEQEGGGKRRFGGDLNSYKVYVST